MGPTKFLGVKIFSVDVVEKWSWFLTWLSWEFVNRKVSLKQTV
jgi:hypothetical protein